MAVRLRWCGQSNSTPVVMREVGGTCAVPAGRGLWATRSGPAVRGREVRGTPSGDLCAFYLPYLLALETLFLLERRRTSLRSA